MRERDREGHLSESGEAWRSIYKCHGGPGHLCSLLGRRWPKNRRNTRSSGREGLPSPLTSMSPVFAFPSLLCGETSSWLSIACCSPRNPQDTRSQRACAWVTCTPNSIQGASDGGKIPSTHPTPQLWTDPRCTCCCERSDGNSIKG